MSAVDSAGYVKTFRSIDDHPKLQNLVSFRLFGHCVAVSQDGIGRVCLSQFARRIGATRKQIRVAQKHLEDSGLVKMKRIDGGRGGMVFVIPRDLEATL